MTGNKTVDKHTNSAQERSTSPQQFQHEATAAAALTHEHPSGVCEILLNRPKKLNAFNTEMCEIMIEKLLAWEKLESSKVIFVKGNGNKAFRAGGDIKALLDLEEAGRHHEAAHIFYRHCQLQHLIGSLKKPYIALMGGITMGAAVRLAMNAPFRIATENSVYSMPENIIGHFNDATQRLQGPDIFYSGIATHYVPAKRINALEATLDDLAVQKENTLDKDDINAVIEKFSAEDIDKEEKAPAFSLGGGIYEAVNRYVTRTKPKWHPPTLEQVDASEMKRKYFDAPIDTPLVPLIDQGGTYMEYLHTRFMLPKCSEILHVANTFGGDRERTVKHLIDKYTGKHGVKAKVDSLF
ncbi:ClpP/crotonase-like domain-containing protein [Zychaea mexicana]|uniref:ClpP/crotonase-like domain-containing protein n=1 Tax=Zychaea mexicana TaxID=64656 RepID=UPI0022FEA8DD|nr:ClpP/crotonase-like domain-containing protein [Zychaea mexicana]KAI9496899.1 ClpP/crotonase-like domain-containing protein [Zychaea mexicana]